MMAVVQISRNSVVVACEENVSRDVASEDAVLVSCNWAWCCRTLSCSTASIRENVGFARPGATDEQILEACRIARVDEFAEKFEKKYDTIVGERGVKLSGGQRQRVSIARAILANPRILILDEATSSLDSESEAAIQEGLQYLMKGRTTFVIAHRLSTIRRADQILVVEAGRIVERGTHESLYALHGRYWDLYTRQHGVDSNLFLAPGEGDKMPEEEQQLRVGAAAPPDGGVAAAGRSGVRGCRFRADPNAFPCERGADRCHRPIHGL